MQTIKDWQTLRAVIDQHPDRELTALLAKRLSQLTEFDDTPLHDIAELHVIAAGDRLNDIVAGLGFDPCQNLVDRTRYGDPGFGGPSWEWVERHRRWAELCFVLTDGFAAVLFVQCDPPADPALMALLDEFAV